jgi:hypothetical protein
LKLYGTYRLLVDVGVNMLGGSVHTSTTNGTYRLLVDVGDVNMLGGGVHTSTTNGTYQLLVDVGDVNMLGGSVHTSTTKENREALEVASKEVSAWSDLEISMQDEVTI